MIQYAQKMMTRLIDKLYKIVTEGQERADVTRFSVAFLNIWQAMVIVNHDYWLPGYTNVMTISLGLYATYACALALAAVIALIFPDKLLLNAAVLAINAITYLALGISAAWVYYPPNPNAGPAFFVMFISIVAFWRVLIRMLRIETIRKRV